MTRKESGNSITICPTCGAEFKAASTGGLCPRCVFSNVLKDIAPQDHPALNTISITGRCPTTEQLNAEIKGLKFEELLGKGGSGWTFRAKQKSLQRSVAVKILSRRQRRFSGASTRFQREAENLAKLNHPSIVTVHDFGVTKNFLYIVMEHIAGPTLRQRIQSERLDEWHAVDIGKQICEAAIYAHGVGLMHRDIKPENVLFVSHDKDAKVKVADFGISKILDRKNTEVDLTSTGLIIGTPFYMAPEQNTIMSGIDRRADLFSIGVLIYEMLTAKLPIGKFRGPSAFGRGNRRLDETIFKALANDPDDRFQSAEEFLHALEISDRPLIPKWPATVAAATLGTALFIWAGQTIVESLSNQTPNPETSQVQTDTVPAEAHSPQADSTKPKFPNPFEVVADSLEEYENQNKD